MFGLVIMRDFLAFQLGKGSGGWGGIVSDLFCYRCVIHLFKRLLVKIIFDVNTINMMVTGLGSYDIFLFLC